jgi:DNA polymerase
VPDNAQQPADAPAADAEASEPAGPAPALSVVSEPEPDRIRIVVREQKGRGGKVVTDEPAAAFERALELTADLRAGEILWDGRGDDLLACLDIDDYDPATTTFEGLISGLAVKPWIAWVSRSGRGLHAIYHATPGYSAGDLARCAAVSVAEVDRSAGVEVLRHSAAPPDLDKVYEFGQDSEPRLPMGWVEDAEVDPVVLDEWLARNDYALGGRYPHDRCPISPKPTHGTEPVRVQDTGIRCYVCGGFRTFARLISGRQPSKIATAAKHFVHWTHARYVMAEDRPDIAKREGFARAVYRSLAKMLSTPDDPRIPSIFAPGLRFVRLSGCWADSTTLTPLSGHGQQLFRSLPSVKYLDETAPDKPGPVEIEVKTSQTELALAASNGVLPGYAEIIPIRGLRLWGIHNDYPPDRRVRGVLPTQAAYPPRYLAKAHRLPEADAWAAIEKSFPGIDRAYLSLLIVARGLAESGVGAVPMILVEGSSGSGKSATVLLAADLIGDTAKIVQPGTAPEKFDRTFGQQAASGAGFIRLDEFGKTTSDSRILEQFEPLYLIERDYGCERMYVGPVVVPVRSVVIAGRVSFPPAVFTQTQITRRFVSIRLLGSTPDWRETSGGIEGWRNRDAVNARVADSLISWLVDRHLATGVLPDLRRVAEDLGIDAPKHMATLDDPLPEERLDTARAVYLLFELIGSGKPSGERRKAANGWKVVELIGQDPLSIAWRDVCDSPDSAGWSGVRNVSAEDLSTLVGFPRGAHIQCQERAGKTLIRFIVGSGRGRNPGPINEAIEFVPRPELVKEGETCESDSSAPIATPSGTSPSISSSKETTSQPSTLETGPSPDEPSDSVTDAQSPTSSVLPSRLQSPPATETTTSPRTIAKSPTRTSSRVRVFVDLETRSDIDLRRRGGRVYSAGKFSSIICGTAKLTEGELAGRYISWQHINPEVSNYCPPGELPGGLREAIGISTLVAHNADGFDRHMWERFYGRHPGEWLDTLKLARASGHKAAGLESLGQSCLGRGKDPMGHRLIRLYSIPRKFETRDGEKRPIFAEFFPDNLLRFMEYCRKDAELLADLFDGGYLTVGKPTDGEIDWIHKQQEINDRGVLYDKDLATELINAQSILDERLGERIVEITDGELDARKVKSNPAAVKRWLAKHGCELETLAKDTVARYLDGTLYEGDGFDEDGNEIELSDPEPVDPKVIEILEARLEIASIVKAKCEAAHRTASPDGRIRDMFNYYGAHTGRESGSGVQPQNMMKPTLPEERIDGFIHRLLTEGGLSVGDEPDLDQLVRSAIRGIFIAPEGRVLVRCDFASVEARVLAWLAGEEKNLIAFREGRDLYKELASVIFGTPVSEVTKEERTVAKNAFLGAGYGMGAESFGVYCAMRGADLAAAGVTPKEVITAFREAVPSIRKLWRDLHDATLLVVTDRQTRTVGRTEWSMRGRDLIARLPSNRELVYADAAVEMHIPAYKLRPSWEYDRDPVPTVTYGKGDAKKRQTTYGGRLTENITQAVARDLLVEAILAIEHETPIEIVLHVHDEGAGEIHEEDTDTAVEAMEYYMSQSPAWAPDLPIEAEATYGKRYGK